MKMSNVVCTVHQMCVLLTFIMSCELGSCYVRDVAADAGFLCDSDSVIGEAIKETTCSMRVMFDVFTAADVISRAAELSGWVR
jgi:hypothetical protein